MIDVEYHTLLRGIVGSTAYGLAGPDSDIDRLGIFAYPTKELFKLNQPKFSLVSKEPDITLHEALKAVQLILSCNPTATEILWLPDHLYERTTLLGNELREIRFSLLSAKRVKDAYMRYATQQFKRLLNRNDRSFSSDTRKRTAKHARHLKRLVFQGYHLYTEGDLIIELENAQTFRDFGEMVANNPETVIPFMTEAENRFKDAKTTLPSEPNKFVVEDWLQRVRKHYYYD